MKIFREKYEKIQDEEIEINIPQEQSFYFETGIRRSICITPEWTTWNVEYGNKPEVIWRLNILCVYQSWETKIENFSIQISEIQRLYNQKDDNRKGGKSIIDFLLYIGKPNRTREQFLEDYQHCVLKFDQVINPELFNNGN